MGLPLILLTETSYCFMSALSRLTFLWHFMFAPSLHCTWLGPSQKDAMHYNDTKLFLLLNLRGANFALTTDFANLEFRAKLKQLNFNSITSKCSTLREPSIARLWVSKARNSNQAESTCQETAFYLFGLFVKKRKLRFSNLFIKVFARISSRQLASRPFNFIALSNTFNLRNHAIIKVMLSCISDQFKKR